MKILALFVAMLVIVALLFWIKIPHRNQLRSSPVQVTFVGFTNTATSGRFVVFGITNRSRVSIHLLRQVNLLSSGSIPGVTIQLNSGKMLAPGASGVELPTRLWPSRTAMRPWSAYSLKKVTGLPVGLNPAVYGPEPLKASELSLNITSAPP
jgi:hypothetical protein